MELLEFDGSENKYKRYYQKSGTALFAMLRGADQTGLTDYLGLSNPRNQTIVDLCLLRVLASFHPRGRPSLI
jgi:hypothetical protein